MSQQVVAVLLAALGLGLAVGAGVGARWGWLTGGLVLCLLSALFLLDLDDVTGD